MFIHIGAVAELISDLFQTNNNYHSYSTRSYGTRSYGTRSYGTRSYDTRSLHSLQTPIVRSEVIDQTFPCITSLPWNYISGNILTNIFFYYFLSKHY